MDDKKLFVGNLSWGTTEEALEESFSQAGEVVSVDLIKERDTGRSKGFGFIEMKTSEGAAKAVEMWNGQELDGRPLTVNIAKPREERPRNDRY